MERVARPSPPGRIFINGELVRKSGATEVVDPARKTTAPRRRKTC
jgi:hypothetical protein